MEVGAGVGWTVYPPLSRRIGIGVDVAIVSLHLSGLSSLAGSINVLTTILLMRGPALAMQRVPLFVWGVLIASVNQVWSLRRPRHHTATRRCSHSLRDRWADSSYGYPGETSYRLWLSGLGIGIVPRSLYAMQALLLVCTGSVLLHALGVS